MKTLPYTAVTTSGAVLDVQFELHPETASPERVGEMLSAFLNALDMQIEGGQVTSNGDILQALAMALALRSEMLPAATSMKATLARDVLDRALASVAKAGHGRSPVGHG